MEEKKRIAPIPPRELKTVEIDVEKKIFRVNGEDFGREATGFTLSCGGARNNEHWFNVVLEICTNITYLTSYDTKGKMTSTEERHPKESDAAND